jgi:cytidylate kinase
MQIICISRGSQSRGEEFARGLASKLGYECISREQLLEEATRRRIPIGKLETAIIKPHIFTEKLALELESYKALATSILCEKALNNNIVYHGRTGHLLLPGIGHILKIRVVSEPESRIENIMQKLQLPRDKAKRYLEQVDEDRRKWVKTFYNVDWDIFNLYDMVLNLSYVNVNNAAAAICNMAQLPEFKATPASLHSLKDLYLASRARLLLLSDRRTSSMNIKVKVSGGVIYITYPTQHAESIEIMNEILHDLKDAREIVYTKAQTNILWIQEEFSADDSSYGEILSLANTWDAAVELLKLMPDSEQEVLHSPAEQNSAIPETWRETGIIEEAEESESAVHQDMSKIYEKLIKDGRAGGKRAITGTQKTLLNAIDRTANYKLIVFDNAFLAKGASARKRILQEWSNSLNDALKTPVVNMNELQYKYRFKPRQFVKMFMAAIATALIVFLIFRFENQIMTFLSNSDSKMRIIAAICVVVFVPVFARLYSSVTGLFLKMIKLE